MTYDQKLVSRAQARAGRHVHAVAGIVQSIVLAETCVRAGMDVEEMKALIERQERLLRVFVATGNLGVSDERRH